MTFCAVHAGAAGNLAQGCMSLTFLRLVKNTNLCPSTVVPAAVVLVNNKIAKSDNTFISVQEMRGSSQLPSKCFHKDPQICATEKECKGHGEMVAVMSLYTKAPQFRILCTQLHNCISFLLSSLLGN